MSEKKSIKDIPSKKAAADVGGEDLEWFEVIVHHAAAESENRLDPIHVNAIGNGGIVIIMPGVKTRINECHYGILLDAVVDTELAIADDSGIYQSDNPLAIAAKNYPGYQPKVDPYSGRILMKKSMPQYVVQKVE